MLRDDWLNIWDNLTSQEQTDIVAILPVGVASTPADFRSNWASDIEEAFRDLFQVLSCRVVSFYPNV